VLRALLWGTPEARGLPVLLFMLTTVYLLQLFHFNLLLVVVVLFHCLVALPGLGYLLFVIYHLLFLSVIGRSFVPFDNAKIECFSRPDKFPATISPQLLRPTLLSATDAPHRPPSCRKLLRGLGHGKGHCPIFCRKLLAH
jgi:hypothetical protein